MLDLDHPFYLTRALVEAKHHQVGPNDPHGVSVGAVVVLGHAVIARGHYRGQGSVHAEVDAIRQLPLAQREQMVLYVTLEPCNHHGNTPPCTDAIIQSGIKQVVFAYKDPNPHVKGQGMQALLKHGVEVQHCSIPEINDFYAPYAHGVRTGMPWVHLKQAACKQTGLMGDQLNRLNITGREALDWTMQERAKADALLTSTATVLIDDPMMTVRDQSGRHQSSPPLIICGRRDLTPSKKVFQFSRPIIHIKDDLQHHLKELYIQGYRRIWMESGPGLATNMLANGLIQRLTVIYSPKPLMTTNPVYLAQYHYPVSAQMPLGQDECFEYDLSTT